MWPFKRKKSETGSVPPEVKQYYDSEHRERVGLAWLVAFMSLLATIAIVAGLFFGGRWLYRKITHKDTTTTTSQGTTEQPAPTSPATPTTPSTPNDLQPAAPSQNQATSSSGSSTNSGTSSGSSSSSSANPSNGSSSSGSSSSSSSSTSATGSKNQSSQVTNTGPGDTLAIFMGVTIVGALAHSAYKRRTLKTDN